MMDDGGSRQQVLEFFGLKKSGAFVETRGHRMAAQSLSVTVLSKMLRLPLPLSNDSKFSVNLPNPNTPADSHPTPQPKQPLYTINSLPTDRDSRTNLP